MRTSAVRSRASEGPRGRSTVEIDQHVGAKIRERRIMLGLSQQQVAEMIGVAYQQTHKYETGINRVSAGRLHQIAQAFGVAIEYFFPHSESGQLSGFTPAQRAMLELARDFARLPSRRHQEALCQLARVLAGGEPPGDLALNEADERAAA